MITLPLFDGDCRDEKNLKSIVVYERLILYLGNVATKHLTPEL